jgi:polyhydroxyalkanoate synthase
MRSAKGKPSGARRAAEAGRGTGAENGRTSGTEREGLFSEGEASDLARRVVRSIDPVGLGVAFAKALGQVAMRPSTVLGPTARFLGGLVQASAATAGRLVFVDAEGPLAPAPRDRRFADAAWSQNAFFYGLLQLYLLNERLITELVDAVKLPEPDAAKARFAAKLLSDAAAPTNYFFTNPKALRRAFDTGGQSVALGARNFLHDLLTNGGWPTQVPKGAFTLGKDLAATKGRVIFKNDLIELIQYEPLTPEVHEVPMLFCPPWINKYYIMDLAPGKSLVEWAVRHGLTVFQISYRNPDASMRDVSFDDYLFQGPRAAIDVVQSITGAPKVNTLSLCLGGTLNAALVGYLHGRGEDVVGSCTYLNSLVDFSGAGVLKDVFTDALTVAGLIERMGRRGYLEADEMAHTFDLMRANDLVFRYVASNWLVGEDPPAFDILAWNNDSTRMPAKMHAYYLRKCWVENALARGELEIGGSKVKFGETANDSYIVAAVNDHIVPWRANYQTTQLLKGERRFVLTSGGHIAGIINPPNPKAKLWTNDALPASPDDWLSSAAEVAGTWWDDWLAWVLPRSGGRRTPPAMGNERYPAGEESPGSYVRG